MAITSKISNIGILVAVTIISVALFSIASNSFNLSGSAVATQDFAMPFAVDAWGYMGWGDCSTQDKGKTWPNQYCISKGYTEAAQCYHEATFERWRWGGTAQIPQKGEATGVGTAFTKVRCANLAVITPIADTTKPIVDVSYSPASPLLGTTVTINVVSTDNVGIRSATVYVDGKSVVTCNTSTPFCDWANTYTVGSHTYYATATDAAGNVGQSVIRNFVILNTKTLEKTATGQGSINLDFGKPYAVTKIDWEGTPGGELCGAGVQVTSWDSINNKYTKVSYSGRVDAHKTVKNTVTFTIPISVRSLRAKPSPDNYLYTNDCTNIDYFKATITYT